MILSFFRSLLPYRLVYRRLQLLEKRILETCLEGVLVEVLMQEFDEGEQIMMDYRRGPTLGCLYHPALCPGDEHFEDLPVRVKSCVEALHKQYDRWSHKPYFKAGLSDRLIAVANDFDFSEKLATCMMVKSHPNSPQPLARCGMVWFCPFCSYLKGQEILKKYVNSWTENYWYHLTLSVRGGILLADPEHDWLNDVWDAMIEAVKRIKEDGLAQGYVLRLELKVLEFWPILIVSPHIHVLMHCDLEPDDVRYRRLIAEEWARRDLRVMPDLHRKKLSKEAHFHEVLNYTKPIDILQPYNRGYRAARQAGKLLEFHQEIRDFLYSFAMEASHYEIRRNKATGKVLERLVLRRRILYGGNCHGSAKNPLGIKLAERQTKAHQEFVRQKVDAARQAEQQAQQETELEEQAF